MSLTYDALGRMMEQNRSGVYTQIVYAPTGEKLALMNGQTLQKAFVPLPGSGAAVYTSSGLSYYRHSDWLGSSRLASTPARTVYSTTAYAPFGEPYAQSGAADLSFTGQNQDTVGGSYDFLFREYATQGRWPSPDPAGLAAVSLDNPQSWNRYAYVLNNPLAYIDPFGLDYCQWDDGSRDDKPEEGGEDQNGCISGGGTWVTDSGPNSGCTWDGTTLNCPGPPDPCALPGFCGGGIGGEPIGPGVGGGNSSGSNGKIIDSNGNPCTPSVFNPSCKPPSCLAVFFNAAGKADPLNLPAVPPGFGPDDAAKAAATALATKHIIERGLVVPLRSSIVRNILSAGEATAAAIVFVPAVIQAGTGLVAEYKARKAGTCTTAFQ